MATWQTFWPTWTQATTRVIGIRTFGCLLCLETLAYLAGLQLWCIFGRTLWQETFSTLENTVFHMPYNFLRLVRGAIITSNYRWKQLVYLFMYFLKYHCISWFEFMCWAARLVHETYKHVRKQSFISNFRHASCFSVITWTKVWGRLRNIFYWPGALWGAI